MSVERPSLGTWLRDHGPSLGAIRISDAVKPNEFEATAILSQIETPDGAPPVVFTRPVNLLGAVSRAGLLMNAYSKRDSVARALRLDASSWGELLEALPGRSERLVAPIRVSDVPVQEIVERDDAVDLRTLPWVRHVELEGGPYFTPILAAKHPTSGRYNLSWNRLMFLDARHAGVHISPRQLWSFQREAEEAGDDLPVAIVLGHHPAFNLAAAALTGMAIDEYHAAGALMASPLAVAPSVSYGEDLLVPADAEVIIEGRLLAGKRVVEGPFGEYMRYVGPQKLSHLFRADAVTYRPNPVILEIFAGHRDHLNAHISIHASLLQAAKSAVPQVSRLGWFQGGGPTTVVVAMRKSAEGQPTRAALAVMAASNLIKQVIIVDDDIDVFDAQEVVWAISTRVRADQDLTVIRGLQGSLLDPSHPGFGTTTGFVLDATWPMNQPHPMVARVPASAIRAYPLSNYKIEEV